MNKLKNLFLFGILLLTVSTLFSSCGKDDENDLNLKVDYDVIQINDVKYACYGHRCPITYVSTWNLYQHYGTLRLPCGQLSDAEKGEYDYDYMYEIYLEGNKDLEKGSKLEDFSPSIENFGDFAELKYKSGSATITDKKDDKYITVKFDSFEFSNGSKRYVLSGTVQLSLDED